ncbi:MAG TPA: multicopper oxidase, partial [Steroidobacteraceae bacterium]
MSLTRRTLLRGAAVGAALAAGSALADPLRLPVQAFCTGNGLRKVVLRKAQPGVVQMLHPERLARFVDPLPIPEILRGAESRPDPQHAGQTLPFHRIAMREAWTNVHRDLPPTRFWGYNGKMPGPTIEVRRDKPVLIEWASELPKQHLFPVDYTLHGAGHDVPDVRAVVHVHGARVPADADGYPENWYVGGKSATYRYPNRQDAATLWYHDHAMGIERLNVYAGLFGTFLVRDEVEESLRLPSGEFEIPLLICDRQFTADGQLYYPTSGVPESPWVSEVYGDVVLMNGKISPYLEVEPRPYRFRMVNASNARFYYIALSDGSPLQQIGSDQGLLPKPVSQPTIMLAPAERADVVIDFGKLAGKTVLLKSQFLELMQFRVAARTKSVAVTPATLRPVKRIARSAAVRTRTLTLNNYIDPKTHMMMMLLNGTYWHQPITEKPVLGSTEIWEFVNLTEDTHPIHLHLVRFQVLSRQRFDVDGYLEDGKIRFAGPEIPPNDNEYGWKDTVQADSGLITRIIVPFEGYPGRYVWHCHVL